MKAPVPIELIERKIYLIRGQKVMLDADLAELYGVETKVLNKAVSRNTDRFPKDFMFSLSAEEHESLRFQIGTLKTGRGQHRKYLPNVFTEQGVAMLSSVLHSKRAAQVNSRSCARSSNWGTYRVASCILRLVAELSRAVIILLVSQ